jgi:hypothetical protein
MATATGRFTQPSSAVKILPTVPPSGGKKAA